MGQEDKQVARIPYYLLMANSLVDRQRMNSRPEVSRFLSL